PGSSDLEKKFWLDLLTITKLTLYHHCTQSCKKYNRGLQKHCRFDFLRELVDPPGQPSDKPSFDLVNRSYMIVTKCLNKILGQTELTSPQVSAYLLGIPDHYTPNNFITIHLKTFEIYLTKDEQSMFNRTDESFFISSFNRKLTTVNLHVDYQFRETVIDLREHYSTWNDSYQSFFNGSSLSPHLKSIISNIELLHRCSEETTLDQELHRNAISDSFLQKLATLIVLFTDSLNFDSAKVIRSGLKDVRMVDEAMSFLRLRGKFNIRNSTSYITKIHDNINLQDKISDDSNAKNNALLNAYINFQNSGCYDIPLNISINECKSKVIDAISSYFEHCSQQNSLLVLAPTGCAAAKIRGNTLYSACGFASHLTLCFYEKVKATDNNTPFAGINILFAGDFMQLPPVLDSALYMLDKFTHISAQFKPQSVSESQTSSKQKSLSVNNHSVINITVRNLWLNVKHVIILKKQMRQLNDSNYACILKNIHEENLTKDQKSALSSRVLEDN
ncbi:20610_t:CDS:2, partial [Cetraspora pellucida]